MQILKKLAFFTFIVCMVTSVGCLLTFGALILQIRGLHLELGPAIVMSPAPVLLVIAWMMVRLIRREQIQPEMTLASAPRGEVPMAGEFYESARNEVRPCRMLRPRVRAVVTRKIREAV